MRLVSNIRDIEKALGDGVKRVYAGELPQLEKLRRVKARATAAASSLRRRRDRSGVPWEIVSPRS